MSEFTEDDLLINDNELKAEEGLDAIESVHRKRFYQDQVTLPVMKDDGRYNMIAVPQRIEPGNDMVPNMMDFSLVLPNPKKTKKDYPWLEVVGEPCYSERQEASGLDLTNVKKKYRKMLCLFCARYNPNTPWSVLKSRKYEADGFAEHEKSSHHVRALYIRDSPEATGTSIIARSDVIYTQYNPVPIIQQLPMANFDQVQQQQKQQQQQIHQHHQQSQAQIQVQEDDDDSDVSSDEEGNHKNVNHQLLAMQIQQQQQQQMIHHQQQAAQAAYQQQQQQYQHQQQLQLQQVNQQQQQQVHLQNVITVPSERFVPPLNKTTQAPDWLRIDGKLSFSDRQVSSGKDLTGMKKKYKKVYCQYCHDFNTNSPWAYSKARKYEASVLSEHNRSHNHKKAVALRDAALNGGMYPKLIPKLPEKELEPHGVHPIQHSSSSSSTTQALPAHLLTPSQPLDPHNMMLQFQQQQMQLKIQHQQQQQQMQQQQHQQQLQSAQAQTYQHIQMFQHHIHPPMHQFQPTPEQQMQMQNQMKIQHQLHLQMQQQQKMQGAPPQQQMQHQLQQLPQQQHPQPSQQS